MTLNSSDAQRINQVFSSQKAYFASGETRSLAFRLHALEKLKTALQENIVRLHEAMAIDLGRPAQLVDFAEIAPIIEEIDFALENLAEWDLPEYAEIPPLLQPSEGEIVREPFGVSYIIGPFNYPIQLLLCPLIGAIATGCTAILKPSESCIETSAVLAKLINDTFAPDYIHLIQGARVENEHLLTLPFDFIFFTGSPQVGKVVMKAAAENLTPVVLELGGKCPAIVEADADLDQTVEQLMIGKFLNAGQTCVAPDYLLVAQSLKKPLLEKMVQAIAATLSEPGSIGKIITQRQIDNLSGMLAASRGNCLTEGHIDRENRYFPATVVDNVDWNDALMKKELFGPILPVLTFNPQDDVASLVNEHHPRPLAAYVFSKDYDAARALIDKIPCGDAQINGAITHTLSPYFPFGGVGGSGMGEYHGKFSYDAFSHRKSIRLVR